MPLTVDPEAIAHWEGELAAAIADHPAAEEALKVAKGACDDACAVLQALVASDPSPENIMAEEAAHLDHRASLEGAFARFGKVAVAELNLKRAHFGLPPAGPNPAPAGETTPVVADVVVSGEVAPS